MNRFNLQLCCRMMAEVELRVTDLPRVVKFYQGVLGSEIVRAYPVIVFLKVGDLDSPLRTN